MIYALIAVFCAALTGWGVWKQSQFLCGGREQNENCVYAQLRSYDEAGNGTVLVDRMPVFFTIGGRKSDWRLDGFPYKENAALIGRTSEGGYSIVSFGLCEVKVGDECLEKGKIRKLQSDCVIQINGRRFVYCEKRDEM